VVITDSGKPLWEHRSVPHVARPLAVVGLVMAVAVLLTACGSSSQTNKSESGVGGRHHVVTAPSTSQEVVFTPYSPQGTVLATIDVTRAVTGTCVSPGVAGTSSYRCFAQPGSTVYDPCFAPPHATSGPLMCVADPAELQAVSFQVSALPSPATSVPATQPWAMQLANGQACIFTSSAWSAGLGPFACPRPAGSASSEADCHAPRKSGVGFEASCQTRETASSTFRFVQVVKVWT
jgi:hypothetical protein